MFSGEEAQALGFATRVCADPLAEALALARDIAGKSPDAIRAAKRLMNLPSEADAATVLLAESNEQIGIMGGRNQVEAVTAGLQKRAPVFIDR
jgi:enoyl-CoA hydratase/carnithine racemase